jgi:hypothetical protein
MMRPRKRVFGLALFDGLRDHGLLEVQIALRHAEYGGTYFVDLKASSPMEEYRMDASFASLASRSATASSVKKVSFWRRDLSMSAKGEK